MRLIQTRRLRNALAAVFLVLAAGCASLPKSFDKHPSAAVPSSASTALGQLAGHSVSNNFSGVRLIASGQEAYASLISLADHAQRSIDVQQYIIARDDSARTILRHLYDAADRGVRVRLLVDDMNTVGQDRRMLRVAEHRNMEIRVFNPFPAGRVSLMFRFVFSAMQIPRINHRMHNKLFVADNAVAITGGRNIGDEYFVRSKVSNFLDLDLLVAGPVVSQLSDSFDAFWNSDYSYPISALANRGKAFAPLKPFVEPEIEPEAKTLEQNIVAGRLDLLWVPAAVLADQPTKIAGDSSIDAEDTVSDSVLALMQTATQEVTIISPYFVPGEKGVAVMSDLVKHGVRVRVLTNSLATTDSPVVHIGYSRYRKPLLRAGVELNEMRAQLGQKRVRFHPFRSSHASLHAKSLVIDHKTVFIGSMNMDARSARTNSELGIVVRSPIVARQVEAVFDDVEFDGSYSLRLKSKHRIEWVLDGDTPEVWTHDPESSLLKRFSLRLISPIAPDDLL